MAAVPAKPKRYIVRFEGNNSCKWDGKEVWLDAEVLDELYDETELIHGSTISVPWKSKGKIIHWKAVFIEQWYVYTIATSIKY